MNIVITGAGKGIGYETTLKLLAQKHTVIAISRNIKALQKTEKKNKLLTCISFDLAKDDFKNLLQEITSRVTKIDVLINNAGKLVNKPFQLITEADLYNVYNVNIFSVFKLTQCLLPLMKNSSKRKSHIVNISSMGGLQGSAKFSGLSAYSSSKGALAILTECLALELQNKNVAVNCLCLGAVQTEMLSKAFPGYKAPVTAKQIAGFISEFAINGADFFNGKILPVSLSTP